MELAPTELSGITLIDQLLEFVELTPDEDEWTLEALQDNEPRLVRLQQLDVLLKVMMPDIYNANDLKSNLRSVLNGDFLLNRSTQQYEALFLQMEATLTALHYDSAYKEEWSVYALHHNYEKVLQYREQLHKLLAFNSGIMEISYPYLYSVVVTKAITKKIEGHQLDQFLSSVIDPLNRTFTREELIKEHGYPDVNLYEIDSDNW